MKQSEMMEIASECGLIVTPHIEKFAKLVAARTLSNIDPSSFMSYQEGFEAGNRLAVDGICRQLRQLHDSYSLASNPSGLKAKNDH